MKVILVEQTNNEIKLLEKESLDDIDNITAQYENSEQLAQYFSCGKKFKILLESDNREIKKPVYYDVFFKDARRKLAQALYDKLSKKSPNMINENTQYWLENMNGIDFRKIVSLYDTKEETEMNKVFKKI